MKNYHPATVVKVGTQNTLRIFDREKYEDILCAKYRVGYEALYNLGRFLAREKFGVGTA